MAARVGCRYTGVNQKILVKIKKFKSRFWCCTSLVSARVTTTWDCSGRKLRCICAHKTFTRFQPATVHGMSEREKTLTINEIYQSIQGESTWLGWPCVFVRL